MPSPASIAAPVVHDKEFLYAVPMILFGVPAFLLGLNALADNGTQDVDGEFELEFDSDNKRGK